MRVVEHRLDGVPFKASPNHGGYMPSRLYGIIHYTAGPTTAGAVASLTAKDSSYVSAHLVIGRDGAAVQLVSFDQMAYHAGESAWDGRTKLNTCSIGIELVNPGYVRPGMPARGPAWPTAATKHKSGGPVREWYLYPDVQIRALVDVCRALQSAYPTIQEWLGHDDVAPARKLDPGPVFPWPSVRNGISNRSPLS